MTTETRSEWIAVGGLTLVALVLRAVHLNEGLFGDELHTYRIVSENGLGGVLSDVYDSSITPPFHYVLAWLAAQVGNPTIWIRVPSLILGTALVPLTYLLGRRTVGSRAGLLAAALIALSPFAIFYATEARAYATMVFLVTLSTLSLLLALDRRGRGWWVVYAVSVALAVYSHYSAVFVLVAQAGWAFWVHRDRFRTLLLAHAAIVVLYLPWVPGFLNQRKNSYIEALSDLYPLTAGRFFEYLARLLPGHPFAGLESVPGRAGLILLAIVLVALVATGLWIARRGRPAPDPSRSPGLIWVLAFATGIGLVTYGAVGGSIFAPRNLNASMPALALVVAAGVMWLGPPLRLVVATLLLAGFVVATVENLDDRYQRPAFRAVADYIDEEAGPGNRVVAADPVALRRYFDREHRVFRTGDGAAWEGAAGGGSVFVVRGQFERGLPPVAGTGDRFYVLREGKRYEGLIALSVGRYEGEASGRIVTREGRPAIELAPGVSLEIRPGAARGFVDRVSLSETAELHGWALGAGDTAADGVLAFVDGRLVAAGTTQVPRADIAELSGVPIAGFLLEAPLSPGERRAARSRLQVFAVAGGQATELPTDGS